MHKGQTADVVDAIGFEIVGQDAAVGVIGPEARVNRQAPIMQLRRLAAVAAIENQRQLFRKTLWFGARAAGCAIGVMS